MRDDVKWQDGQPLTANDIAFTYNKTLDCQLGNSLDYLVPDFTDSITATSPTQLVWTTKEPTTRADPSAVGLHRPRAHLGGKHL